MREAFMGFFIRKVVTLSNMLVLVFFLSSFSVFGAQGQRGSYFDRLSRVVGGGTRRVGREAGTLLLLGGTIGRSVGSLAGSENAGEVAGMLAAAASVGAAVGMLAGVATTRVTRSATGQDGTRSLAGFGALTLLTGSAWLASDYCFNRGMVSMRVMPDQRLDDRGAARTNRLPEFLRGG